MTRKDQFKNSRAWQKMRSFAITNSLRKKLEAIPVAEREGYCYVQNQVLIFTNEFDQQAASIHCNMWKAKLGGSGYRKVLNQLNEWGEVEYDGDFKWSKDKSGWCKSYSVPEPALASGTCIVDFERERIRLPRKENMPTDAVSRYALECLFKLEPAESLVYPEPDSPDKNPDVRKARIRWHCEHIAGKNFSLKYGKNVGRLYHRVLMMPREGRCNLTYCFDLAEYDVRTCHPLLMLKLFTDPTERAAYAEMLRGDIYSRIGQEMNIDDRKRVKDDLQRVVNLGHKTADWMAKQYVFQFYHLHFPTFAEQVLFQRKDLAAYLQNLEARLMVQRLGSFCREHGLFWIPMHDGFIARMDQGKLIEAEASKIIQAEINLAPQMECTPLHSLIHSSQSTITGD